MSEELKARGLTKQGVRIGDKFEYFNIGGTTLSELGKYGIIPNIDYKEYNKKRPDGLLIDRTNSKKPRIIAVVEYKNHSKFKNSNDVTNAIRQCNDYAQVLDAKFGVITDTNVTYWINPHQKDKDNVYLDSYGDERGFSFIKNENKQNLTVNFILQSTSETNEDKLDGDTKNTLKAIKRILCSDIGADNSEFRDTQDVDPTPLAKSVWQDIYVATGKEPEKCLYNVVELFIFKFLSDLGVLSRDRSFSHLIKMYEDKYPDAEILEHYATKCRTRIRELFPKSTEDNTTIINGTIFVNEKGEPVIENALLFRKSIEKYSKFGDLTNVDKSFKTKLYETFLKRDNGVKGMGQFFTPRKVVQAIVGMAKVENLHDGAKVCDPFCGVGGFPLEVMAKRNNKDFEISGTSIRAKVKYFGFDKGSSEKDSERTIILAKANMLIYLSELVKEHTGITNAFSELFNQTFKLKKGTLGSLSDIDLKEDNLYDLIVTNPPYVTSGSSILKSEIKNDGQLSDFYRINAMGVEGLALEWIIRKLKKGGRAFVIVPDGIFNRLNDRRLREFILKECCLNGIISLPINTFFTTQKKTYILVITKKHSNEDEQSSPVFTYLVSDIGETLDMYRFDTGNSDLEVARNLFRMFHGNEDNFSTTDGRCKIQPITKFKENIGHSWTIDEWWTEEEKISLGIQERKEVLELDQFLLKIQIATSRLKEIESEIENLI